MYNCPVCLTDSLEDPYTPNSFDICGMCGVEFGYEDTNTSHEELRKIWLDAGSPNWQKETVKPDFKGGVKWFDDYFERNYWKVELLDIFGDDLTVCDSARVSFGKSASGYTLEDNIKLIKYLAEHNHIAPFFHPQLRFRLKMPIYVERQIFKTQSGVSVNSISGRYVDFSDTYTKIGDWRAQSKSSKQGSSESLPLSIQSEANKIEEYVINTCKEAYKKLLDLGASKEQARTVLPLNLNTECIWTGSLYALIRLCKLRIEDSAQKETRYLVEEMLSAVKKTEKFRYSLEAFSL